ncbi:MAG: hypothetical protein K5776_02575, partial [Lachnospiraceae bacterium]|nr:hypothetical protein [Lachnospiraceae bacterium]
EPIEEGERKMNYNNFDEKEAVKRVVRSFVGLLKVFSKEKSKIQYEKLTVAEANYFERMIPEGEIEECDIYYDGSVFRYEKIEEKADEVRTELIVAAMDMPESIIKDLDFLLANIALGDETEKNFVHDEDFEEENYYGSCDCFNIGEVMQSVMGYYDNLMEILKPYNLGLEKYRALVY